MQQCFTRLFHFQEFRGADGGEDNSRVKNRVAAKAAAQALELESVGELCFALTTLRTETRGQCHFFYTECLQYNAT